MKKKMMKMKKKKRTGGTTKKKSKIWIFSKYSRNGHFSTFRKITKYGLPAEQRYIASGIFNWKQP